MKHRINIRSQTDSDRQAETLIVSTRLVEYHLKLYIIIGEIRLSRNINARI